MKQVVLLFSALILISCNKFKVEGTAKGVKDGTKVFLEGAGEMGPVAMDTVEIKEGKFEFEGKSELPEIGIVSIDGVIDPQYQSRKSLPFIIESGTIEIAFDTKDIQKSRVSGTTDNDLFQKYTDESVLINKPIMDFQKNNNEAMKKAMETNDVVVQKQLNEEYGKLAQSISAKMDAKSKDFIKNNPSSMLSMLFLENYVSRGTMQGKEAKDAFEKLDKKLHETKSGKNVKKALDAQLKAAAPEKKVTKAPDFSAKTPQGKTVSLKESLGKVTIIDFWASWCGPCRAENPNVVAIYNELHSKGLNIIGVSLDDDAADWKAAIAKDKLTWTQVSNLKKWKDPIALDYEIDGIPATFILDAKGNIVAKNLRGDELKAKVKEILGIK